MIVGIEAVDYGPITFRPSPENPECTRLTIEDKVGELKTEVDLSDTELTELTIALDIYRRNK